MGRFVVKKLLPYLVLLLGFNIIINDWFALHSLVEITN